MRPDKPEATASRYASMTDAERAHRLEEYVTDIDVHSDVEEFASLICGEDVHSNGVAGEQMTAAEQAAGEATIKQLFDERDTLPEGSPERHAVALKIFDFTFGGK